VLTLSKKKELFVMLSISLFFLTCGCAAIVAGGAAVGAGAGTYLYVNGELRPTIPILLKKPGPPVKGRWRICAAPPWIR